jgi:hypothetical protein
MADKIYTIRRETDDGYAHYTAAVFTREEDRDAALAAINATVAKAAELIPAARDFRDTPYEPSTLELDPTWPALLRPGLFVWSVVFDGTTDGPMRVGRLEQQRIQSSGWFLTVARAGGAYFNGEPGEARDFQLWEVLAETADEALAKAKAAALQHGFPVPT